MLWGLWDSLFSGSSMLQHVHQNATPIHRRDSPSDSYTAFHSPAPPLTAQRQFPLPGAVNNAARSVHVHTSVVCVFVSPGCALWRGRAGSDGNSTPTVLGNSQTVSKAAARYLPLRFATSSPALLFLVYLTRAILPGVRLSYGSSLSLHSISTRAGATSHFTDHNPEAQFSPGRGGRSLPAPPGVPPPPRGRPTRRRLGTFLFCCKWDSLLSSSGMEGIEHSFPAVLPHWSPETDHPLLAVRVPLLRVGGNPGGHDKKPACLSVPTPLCAGWISSSCTTELQVAPWPCHPPNGPRETLGQPVSGVRDPTSVSRKICLSFQK